jgi:hypothetical protein
VEALPSLGEIFLRNPKAGPKLFDVRRSCGNSSVEVQTLGEYRRENFQTLRAASETQAYRTLAIQALSAEDSDN